MPDIWPFRFLRAGFREHLGYRNVAHEQSGGRVVIQAVHAAPSLTVSGRVLFPNDGGSYSDLSAFWTARAGMRGTFLYMPQNPGASAQGDTFVAAAAQQNFSATRRYVDTATLVVTKGGVIQTLTTHYTLQNEAGGAYVLGTSTTLVVRFVAAPGAGVAVALAYRWYAPMRFSNDEALGDQEIHAGGAGRATTADRTVSIELREAGPGYSYAVTPNVL